MDENHNIKKFMIKKNMSETSIVALAVLLVSKLNLHVVVFVFFSPKERSCGNIDYGIESKPGNFQPEQKF